MDSRSCHDCVFFQKYRNAKVFKTKGGVTIALLDSLPRNKDNSINYEDIVFAVNAGKALGIEPKRGEM